MISAGSRAVRKSVFIVLLALATFGLAHGEQIPPHQVAVLDVESDGDSTDENWSSGVADFLEMELQKQGVVTLERRQIRLLLNERELSAHHLTIGNVRADQLPSVEFFIGGNLRRISATEFSLTVSIIRSKLATVESSFVESGNYPEDLNGAVQLLGRRVAEALRQLGLPVVEKREFQSLTWMPEAALPFFKGMEFYAQNDFPLAIAFFRRAETMDGNFVIARLWEARAYERAGFSELAQFTRKTIRDADLPSEILNTNLPVVAVIARQNISAEAKAAFANELSKERRLQIFEPQWISASAREVDLQLTGQMAAPLAKKSIWLVVDEIIYLDLEEFPNRSELRARQQRLISGEELLEVSVTVTNHKNSNYATLAQKLLAGSGATEKSETQTNENATNLEEPQAGDSSEIGFAKALRLMQSNRENPRYLVGLADSFGWEPKAWLLDRAVEAIGRNKEQKNAAFWLTSALWKKRMATPWAVFDDPRAPWRRNVPLREYFAKLLEWFPKSVEAKTLQEIPSPISYKYGKPENHQYMFPVYNRAPLPHEEITEERAVDALIAKSNRLVQPQELPREKQPETNALSDAERLEKIRRYREANDLGRTIALAYKLQRTATDGEIKNEALKILWEEQKKNEKEQNDLLAEFQKHREAGEFEKALAIGKTFLDRSSDQSWENGEQRQKMILDCREILERIESVAVGAKFFMEQAERYKETFGADLRYLTLMGKHAERMLAKKRLDLAVKIFEQLRSDPLVPIANRLTATYDRAMIHYQQAEYFEAIELLTEVYESSKGSVAMLSRKSGFENIRIEEAAYQLLKRVRLFAAGERPLEQCCGLPAEFPALTEKEVEETAPFLGELIQKIRAQTNGASAEIENEQAANIKRVLAVLVHQLKTEQSQRVVFDALRSSAEMGTNAAPLVSSILPLVISGKNQSFAVYALGEIGKPAACAVPVLILSMEEGNPNAKEALRKIGPAPTSSVPYLAELLYHPSTVICRRVAHAILRSTKTNMRGLENKSEEEILNSVRHWWKTEGVREKW